MAKAEGNVARRYARALFELCPPEALDSDREALHEVALLWCREETLRDALNNPAIPMTQRIDVIAALVERVKSGDTKFKNFIMLLFENRRLGLLSQIDQLFAAMIDQMRKLLALEITSAFEIESEEKNSIQDRIKADFGTLATITWSIDRTLLGGLLIKTGDLLLDSSVRGSLDKIRAQLAA